MAQIAIEHLAVSYGGARVIDDLSLTIEDGSLFTLAERHVPLDVPGKASMHAVQPRRRRARFRPAGLTPIRGSRR